MTEIDRAMSIEVTQADRDAAAEWMRAKHPDSAFTDLSITLARHRQQAVAAEVAQIVAWLRKYDLVVFTNVLADAIERGEYKTKETADD